MTTTTQTQQILAWLKGGETLTGMDALKHFGCWRLPARVLELRKQGYRIHREIIETDSKKHVARYRLDKRQGTERRAMPRIG